MTKYSATDEVVFRQIIGLQIILFLRMFKPILSQGKSVFRVAYIFLGVLTISACNTVDLSKVQEFANLAEIATERSEQVGDDFYPSCLRQAQYVPVIPLPTAATETVSSETQIALDEVTDAVHQELEELESARQILIERLQESLIDGIDSGSSDPLVVRNELRELCDRNLQGIGPDFSSVNGVVILYVKTLGLVANKSSTGLESEFNVFRTSATNLSDSARSLFSVSRSGTPIIPQEQLNGKINAAISILQFITGEILEGQRREILEEVIVAKNDDFQEVISALKIVVNEYYIGIALRNEERALDTVYTTYIDALEQSQTFQSGESVISVTKFLIELEESWSQKKEVIQARREAAQAYIGVLNALSSGHQELFQIFSDGDEPTEDELQGILDSNTAALKNFVNKSNHLSIKESQK